MSETFDLVIIGGGVIGLSCALHLRNAKPGLRLAILDLPNKPGISSRSAGGFLSPYCEFKVDSPLFHLARESYEYFNEFLARFGLDRREGPIVDAQGVLLPVNSSETTRSQEIAEHAAKYVQVKTLDARELLSVEPHLNTEACQSAYLLPGAMIDSVLLHRRMYEACRSAGVTIIKVPIKGVSLGEQRIGKLELEDGSEVAANDFLLAAGVWSKTFAEMLGFDMPIIPVKGHVARFQIADGFLRHIFNTRDVLMGSRCGLGIIVGATVEYVGFDDTLSDEAIANLCNGAAKYLPALWNQELAESWFGFRPKLADGDPAIGWSSRIENLLIATGHFRNGVLLAPITGQLITRYYLRREASVHMMFAPGRLEI